MELGVPTNELQSTLLPKLPTQCSLAELERADQSAETTANKPKGKGRDTVDDQWIGTSETDPIQVDFLSEEEVPTPGRLGMTFAPGMWAISWKGRWGRDLQADMRELES
jgi:hypothetical protein